MEPTIPSDAVEQLRTTFLGILAHDAICCIERLSADDSQASRRDLIRTIFAAVEGLVWEYRKRVRSVAEEIHSVSPLMGLALSEASYSVADNGKIDEQIRFVPLPAMIRLVTRLACEICPELQVDFGTKGWKNFKEAINIRV